MSQFVYFSLILREREETKTKYSAPKAKLPWFQILAEDVSFDIRNSLFFWRKIEAFRDCFMPMCPFDPTLNCLKKLALFPVNFQ